MRGHSYRAMLRASSLLGSASILTMVCLLIKMKVIAIMAGAAGVGLVGLYQSLIQTASAIANLGLVQSGTREVAAAHAPAGESAPSDPDEAQLGLISRALGWAGVLQAGVAAAVIMLASDWIAQQLIGDVTRASDVKWLALAVAAMVMATSPMALLQGMRRIKSIAAIQVVSGLLSTIVGVVAMAFWGAQALLFVAVSAPIITWLAWRYAAARVVGNCSAPASEMLRAWRMMAQLGVAFMLSGLITMAGYLAVRVVVQRELGMEALGLFQAAWAIGTTYLALVLNAMSTDFYPRLSAAIHDKPAAVRLINEQTEMGLLLCAPLLLALIGLSPWVVQWLYTEAFYPAASMLRWQLLGDILKVMSWPLGMVLLAAGAGKTFVLSESLGIAALLLGTMLLLPIMGIEGAGAAYLLHYALYLPLVWWLACRHIHFRWGRAVMQQALLLSAAALVVEVACRISDISGAVAGVLFAAAFGGWALYRLRHLTRN